jgi:hypothetical protein
MLTLALAIMADPPISSVSREVINQMAGCRRVTFHLLAGGDVMAARNARLWAEDFTPGMAAAEPLRLHGVFVPAGMFDALRVKPILGRVFHLEADSPDAPLVLLLSYSLWQRRFAGDLSIIGRKVILDGRTFTVIGVMPAWFETPGKVDIWASLSQLARAGVRSTPPLAKEFAS